MNQTQYQQQIVEGDIISGGIGQQQIHDEQLVITFVFGCLLIGSFFRLLNKRYGLPYTPVIFVIGLIGGLHSNGLGSVGQALILISEIKPHSLLQIFLPILIFETGFNIDWHVFRTQLSQILILSFPVVFVNAILMMFSIKIILNYDDNYYTWIGAFMFGSIVSCTDPLSVISLLKDQGSTKKLNTLIEGESLINTGTAMILYQVGSSLYKNQLAEPLLTSVIGLFIQLTVGGIVLGFVVGIIAGWLINKMYNDEILVVNVTLIGGFIVFFLAETIFLKYEMQVSGIMAIISIGVFMSAVGRTKINPEIEYNVHAFWRFLVFIAETSIYILAGVMVGCKVIKHNNLSRSTEEYWSVVWLYLMMNVVRVVSVGLFLPMLRKRGYGLDWKELMIMTYGGLRGAIGMSLAMIANQDQQLDLNLRDIILFDMCGCVVLTLIINASTVGLIIRLFGILDEHRVKDQMYIQFLQAMLDNTTKQESLLKNSNYMNLVDWNQVYKISGLDSINKEIIRLDLLITAKINKEKDQLNQQFELKDRDQFTRLLDEEENQLTDQEKPLLSEFRSRYISILQQTYSQQFHNSNCTGEAYLLLNASANWDQDRFEFSMSNWKIVNASFYKYHYIKILHDMRKLPLIGSYVRNIVFNHISYAYQVVVTFIQAHLLAEQLLNEFLISNNLKQIILNESTNNRELAENYLYNYLMLSYPEITRSIQTKKAATELLEFQKKTLKENMSKGHIDDKEYEELRSILDLNIVQLSNITPDFQKENAKQYIENLAICDFISDQNIDKILLESFEKTYEKDFRIMKEQENSKFVYIIIRGAGQESCQSTLSHLVVNKQPGDIVGLLSLVQNTNKYQTAFTSDTVLTARAVPIGMLRKIVSQHLELEQFIWKQSIFEFIRINLKDLPLLASLSQDEIYELLKYSTFQKYEQSEQIDITQGALFLQGLAVDTTEPLDFDINNYLKLDPNTITIQHLTNEKNYKYFKPKYIKPLTNQKITIIKTTSLFVFNNYLEVEEILQNNFNHQERLSMKFTPSTNINLQSQQHQNNQNQISLNLQLNTNSDIIQESQSNHDEL